MNNLKPFFIREQIIKTIRNFFYNQFFHEVIVPVLHSKIPNEANLHPFTTGWITNFGIKKYYLSTSPERTIKKMIGKGLGNCFAISPSFRNLENSGSLHNPEFLMLEWYQKNATHTHIMNDVERLFTIIKLSTDKYQNIPESKILIYQNIPISFSTPWKRISLAQKFEDILQISFKKIILKKFHLINYAKQKGYTIHSTWEELYNQIFVSEIESKFPHEPFFLTDFPSIFSPLCTPQISKPYLAQRFELYIGRMEIGNGNTENTDITTVKSHFQKVITQRKKNHQEYSELDTEFLESLTRMQKTSYAGIGMGIDRIAMLFSNISSIEEFNI